MYLSLASLVLPAFAQASARKMVRCPFPPCDIESGFSAKENGGVASYPAATNICEGRGAVLSVDGPDAATVIPCEAAIDPNNPDNPFGVPLGQTGGVSSFVC